MPLIIDTDPGVDDALAIMYAILSGMNIRGLTTVFGNVGVDQATINALTILKVLGADIPVAKGAPHALRHIHCVAESHGFNGLSGFTLDNLDTKPDALNAMDFMLQQLTKEKTSLVCIGPTTNLAALCDYSPETLSAIDSVVILGGAFELPGNTTLYAEFNVFSDPASLEKVLSSGLNPVIIPQEICQHVVCSREDFANIGTGQLAKQIRSIVETYIAYYEREANGAFNGGVMYDVLAVAYMLLPDAFRTTQVHIDVDTGTAEKRGHTIVTNGTPNARLVTHVDADRVRDSFLSTLKNAIAAHSD